jgi:hypothetical protein
MSNKIAPSIFISYSWDDDAHKHWVRSLAERLVTNGVSVALDQWDVQPGESLTSFMEVQASKCDHVLIICTPTYALKSTERKGGVGYEQQIISGQIAAGIDRRKFIPIVRRGEFTPGEGCAIPPHFLGIFALDMREGTHFDDVFEVLIRTIFREPKFPKPELGKKPDFMAGARLPNRALRLPSLEFDGWELRSGVASAEASPNTFQIPSAEDRSNIGVGDIVKLHFSVAAEDEEDPEGQIILNERMWVIVKGASGPYLWGVLDNVPSWNDDECDSDFDLKLGSEIVFLPEHILDFHYDAGMPK